ncbi:MAG: hypothetical protein MK185_01040 [Saccharospirillaceae bacterium]|nr:hypothetical protein [Saccharospirillaceae bacterium]
MEDESKKPRMSGERKLTYAPWHEHVKEFFVKQWKRLLGEAFVIFSSFWVCIEALNFYFESWGLSKLVYLLLVLGVSAVFSLIHCISLYRSSYPEALENESLKVKKIAFSQKPFWEYSLAYELLNSRVESINTKLDDVLRNRVIIEVEKVMDIDDYISWLKTRPENLIRIVQTSHQLLVVDLLEALHADETNEVDFHNLIRVVDLIKDAYQRAYEFEIAGRKIKVPEGFETVHEIQAGWAAVVRNDYVEMLSVIHGMASRNKGDYSPLIKTIETGALPRIDEYCAELDLISDELESGAS